MLVEEQFDRLYFRDVVNEIFATDPRDKAEALVEDYSLLDEYPLVLEVPFGKKTVNAQTKFGELFE